MTKTVQKSFKSPTKGKLNLNSVAREISGFINEDREQKYHLIVGTDSDAHNGKKTDFVTAIIVYRVGRGGRYFWQKNNGGRVFHTLRDRIHNEVTISLQVAQSILGELEKTLVTSEADSRSTNYDFQIHIDVGQNGPTRDMVREVVGMVKGSGFKALIKPDSYAASSIADKYV
jgi:hypothetical protein